MMELRKEVTADKLLGKLPHFQSQFSISIQVPLAKL
jgi:hypothetical protein